MNHHKKTWFLTDRKPISRSGGLIFLLSLFNATGPGGLLFFLWKLGVGVYYSGGSFILLACLGNGGLLFWGVVYLAG